MNTNKTIITCIVALVLIIALGSPASAYRVSYEYYVYASDSDGTPIMDEAYLDGVAYCQASYRKDGGYGNYGTADYRASLRAGTVQMHAHAHGTQISLYNFPSATGRVERVEFMDNLTYSVPAGTYPDGVEVSISGWGRGEITSAVGGGAQAFLWVSHGAEVYETGLLTAGIAEANTVVVDDSFTLIQQLVAPGTTLATAATYDRQVVALIHRGWTWTVAYNPGGGYVTGDGTIDFTEGLRITAVNVPPGVTWTSESGQFLTAVAGVGDDRAAAPAPQLYQNHPNPFNPRTTIAFDLPRDCRVNLGIYDLSGRLVKTLLAGEAMTAGRRQRIWFGRDDAGAQVATGVYFYRLEADGAVETKAMTLMK